MACRLIGWGTSLCVGILLTTVTILLLLNYNYFTTGSSSGALVYAWGFFFVNYRNYFTTTELLYDYFTSGSSGGALVYAWGSRV